MRAPRVRVGVLSCGNSPAQNPGALASTLPKTPDTLTNQNAHYLSDVPILPTNPTLQSLPELLSSHGHEVTQLTSPQEIPHLEVIFLQGHGQALSHTVEEIAPYIHPGQIVIHTSAQDSIQVLDPAEIRGAVVICAYPVAPDLWVTTTLDEVGATVAELFFGGIGARVVPLQDTDRPDFLAALQRAQELQREYTQAAQWLSHYLPDPQAVAQLLTPATHSPTANLLGSPTTPAPTTLKPPPFHHSNPQEAQ